MTPEAEKLWQSPEGGKLAAAMMGLRPMSDEERKTLDAILAAQKAARPAITQADPTDPDAPPEDI